MFKRILFSVFLMGPLSLNSQTTDLAPSSLPLLRVSGVHIVDPAGKPVVLKGLNICYPADLQARGHWSEGLFTAMADWGAQLVRVPIDPESYRKTGAEGTFRLLDQAVEWSKKHGMYVMIDWHSIGNPVQGIFQDPWAESLRTTPKEMEEFWKAAAERYKGEPTVAFYDIFNEPTAIAWKGGHLAWAQWRDLADSMIDVIYRANPRAIPVVGGVDWAYDLKGAASEPCRNQGVVYAAHPYPGHASQPWEEHWERDFGFLAKTHPVMLAEFGFDPHDTVMPSVYKANKEYGKRILAFAQARGMSWTAFVFSISPGWPMPLIKGWDYHPTESGKFFKKALGK